MRLVRWPIIATIDPIGMAHAIIMVAVTITARVIAPIVSAIMVAQDRGPAHGIAIVTTAIGPSTHAPVTSPPIVAASASAASPA